MQKNNLIFLLVGGLVLLGLGYIIGQAQTESSQTKTPLSSLIESKVTKGLSTTALGEVIEISGRNITLSNEGDILTISIKEDATIARLAPPTETTEAPQPVTREGIELEEIKVGDQINILSQLKADGTLEGIEVTVLP